MGQSAYIFKSSLGTFAAGGISDTCNQVVVVNVPGPSEPSPERPGVMLVAGAFPGICIAVPVDPRPGAGPMMGGSYIAIPGGAISDKVQDITGQRFYGAVPLHDRYETVDMGGN